MRKKVGGSLALRLTIWFFILSILPLAVMAIFVRGTIAQRFIDISVASQAKAMESILEGLRRSQSAAGPGSYAFKTADGLSWGGVVDRSGLYLAHPDASRQGQYAFDDLPPEVLTAVRALQPGEWVDEARGLIFTLRVIPGTDTLLIGVGSLGPVERMLAETQLLALWQLAASLFVISVAGGVVIWIVVGSPLTQLTAVAQRIGSGDLAARVNPDEMEAELSVLGGTLNQMSIQLQTLITGLEHRVLELNRAQESLTQSEHRFRTILDSVNDAILVHETTEFRILDANQKMTEMFGYDRGELVGQTIAAISSGRKPFTLAEASMWMKKTMDHGPQLFEWLARDRQGREFWVEINTRSASVNEEQRLLIALRDITGRKRADQVRIAFYRISQAAQMAFSLNELYKLIHGIIGELMPARNFYITLYDPIRNEFYYPYFVDEYDETPDPHRPDMGLTSYVFRTRETILVTPDVFDDLCRRGEVESLGAECVDWLGAPLSTSRGVVGVMALQTYAPQERLSADDKEVFSLVSTQVGMAVERKRAEDALREAEARWRTLMENAPQIIMTIDPAGQILFYNRIFPGFSQADAVGASLFGFAAAENRARIEAYLAQVFDEGIGVSFELPVRSPEGRQYWYACSLAPLATEWRIGMAILNATDITDRKRAEEALRASELLYRRAIEAAGAVPYYHDYKTGSFTFIGARIKEMTGFDVAEMSPDLWDAITLETRLLGDLAGLSYNAAVSLARSGRHPIWQCDYRIRTRDGTMRWVYESAIEVLSDEGPSQGSIGILQDITDRVQAQTEIQVLNEDLERRVAERTEQLEAANKELEAFSYSVSHDLRAPLRALDGFSNILLQEYGSALPPDGVNYVNIVRENARQMGRLIDDLLAFSRLGRQPLLRQKVSFKELITQALQLLVGEQDGRPVEWQLDPLPDCMGDPALLKQVWINLISNALKFTRQCDPAVIHIGCTQENGEDVYFISDNGTGFDMRYADKLFGVFQRLHRAEDYEGTGVGLAIVQRIIRRHEGHIWADSAPGRGATFYFTMQAVPHREGGSRGE